MRKLIIILLILFPIYCFAGTRAIQFESIIDGVLDPDDHAPMASGTVYFYSAGTSNAKNVWTEKEKTNAYTSYTLDSNGAAQLYGDGLYKVVLKDSDGNTEYTWDNVKIQANTFSVSVKNGTYTVTPDDDVVLCNGTFTVSLQTVANFDRPVVIKNIGSGTITVDPYSTQTIDGSSTIAINTQNYTLTLIPDTNSTTWRKSVDGTTMQDADSDTLVQVEESSDEDKVRVDTGGTERVVIDSSGLEVTSGHVVGTLRTANNTYILGRNQADDANVNLIKVNANDEPEMTEAPVVTESGLPTTGANQGALYAREFNGATAFWFATESAGQSVPVVAGGRRAEFFRAKFSYKDDDEIYLDDGSYLVKDKWAWWDSQITEQIAGGSPDASDWYYIYLDYSAITSGTEITATEVINSTTEPSWSSTYRGWYNGDDLCIFAIFSNSTSDVDVFAHDGGDFVQEYYGQADMSAQDIDTTATQVTLKLPAFSTRAYVLFINGTDPEGWIIQLTEASNGERIMEAQANDDMDYAMVSTGSDQSIWLKALNSDGSTILPYTQGWYFPRGM